ncbi:unnamed protein product [Orchesella dallaii]|uniref:Nucleoporin Nup54 alpha-helical domain-containing protein n=1 Tax=Orchesella dallaii TaxID=48710 RepID=A0ABP1QYS0_9HEXA
MQQSFSFGQAQPQPQQPTFGSAGATTGFGGFGGGFSQPTSQPSFGTSFAAPATSTAAPAFGTGTSFGGFGGTSTFGAPQTGTATAFGAPQTTGSAFGAPQLSSTPFGAAQSGATTFGTATQPVATGFGTSTAGGFGTGQTGSLFGSAQPATSSAFGTGQTGFGQQPTGGFGSTLGTSTFGATTQPSLFGSTQPTTAFGQPQTSTFGTTQSGSWLGAGQQQSTFSGFGGATGGSLFGQPQKTGFSFGQPQPSLFSQPTQQFQQPQQQQVMIDEQAAFHQSIFSCCRFGDERDAILANLNFIQSCWGTGKGFYNQSHPPVMFNDKNVFYRFKAVGYSFMYTDSNEDGQVIIQIKKPHTKVRSEESTFINTLQNMIAKPNIFFKITGSKAVNEEMTVIILTADDKQSLRRVLATDLAAALVQPQLKPQLDNLGIVDVCAKVKPSPEQLKAYLENPPAGVDPRVWKKAQEDNPDPANMIPFPLIGPAALKQRLDVQVKESQQHQERLKLISDEVSNLTNRHANISAELIQMRRRSTVMSHRIISVRNYTSTKALSLVL